MVFVQFIRSSIPVVIVIYVIIEPIIIIIWIFCVRLPISVTISWIRESRGNKSFTNCPPYSLGATC